MARKKQTQMRRVEELGELAAVGRGEPVHVQGPPVEVQLKIIFKTFEKSMKVIYNEVYEK